MKRNYKIRIYDMIDGGWFWSTLDPSLPTTRFTYNMLFNWAWNDQEEQLKHNDGTCVYIQY